MLDACEIESRGIPTVTIAQNTFEKAANFHATVLGMPTLKFIIEPAPATGTIGREGLAEIVRQNEQVIVQSLTHAPSKSTAENA